MKLSSKSTLHRQYQAAATAVAGTLDLVQLTVDRAGQVAGALTAGLMVEGVVRLQLEGDVIEHHFRDEEVE